MELKFNCDRHIVINGGVSIVPLWNWNKGQKGHGIISQKFQSYLYGIEILLVNAFFDVKAVSIVPLWNWNYFALVNISAGNGFNRTFMELK